MSDLLSHWEYRIEEDLSPYRLVELGADGWELTTTADLGYIFKRAALSFVERVTLEQRARYYESLSLESEQPR